MQSGSLSSRERILEATAVEYCERGPDGLRMEHVAKRAGVNKALVYRWFGDRENLVREALRRQFSQRETAREERPRVLSSALIYWSEQTRMDPTFARLILREALADRGEEPVHGEQRRAYYRRQIDDMREFVRQGQLQANIDSEMLFLAFVAIVLLPAALPQVIRLATQTEPTSQAFQDRWSGFLFDLAECLAPRT